MRWTVPWEKIRSKDEELKRRMVALLSVTVNKRSEMDSGWADRDDVSEGGKLPRNAFIGQVQQYVFL
jgi:hypothetical protein